MQPLKSKALLFALTVAALSADRETGMQEPFTVACHAFTKQQAGTIQYYSEQAAPVDNRIQPQLDFADGGENNPYWRLLQSIDATSDCWCNTATLQHTTIINI